MCGIAGIAGSDALRDMPNALETFADCLSHRGPDDVGFLGWSGRGAAKISRDPHVAAGSRLGFAHRRLSILDLTEAARQPMTTGDGRYCIVFNGEIYNYLELRRELADLGCTFSSRGDTEVLLAAYARWGREALTRFVGMFAFAILDTTERTLLLARDFFGIKPLYYTLWRGRLAFASEIKALLTLPGLARTADPGRLYDYLRFGLTDHRPETMFAGIRRLPPAHYMEVRLDGPYEVEPVRYWRVQAEPMDISFEAAAAKLREMFLKNIELHLRSDVPVGAALSGGIDSSAIVMGMRRVQQSASEVRAFTHVAQGELSEERWADLVAGEAGAQIHKVCPQGEELAADMDDLISVQGEPFGGTSIYAQFRVFRLAAGNGVKVMLDGQGADELLAGYRPYIAARALSLLRRGRIGRALSFLWQSSKLPGTSALRMLLRAMGLALPGRLQGPAMFLAGESLMPRWMNSSWFARVGVRGRVLWRSKSKHALLEQLEQAVTANALPMLLRYEDRNSMAHSVESRVPFLTPSLVNFVLSLPEEYLLSPDAASKAVFREAMRGIVPDSILARRDKIGFAAPERQWFAVLRPWVDRTLAGDAAREIPAIRAEVVKRKWRRIAAGGPLDPSIWRCLNLIRWAEYFNVGFEV